MFHETILSNNLTVIYEQLPHLRSVAFGIWIGAGSRFEPGRVSGISHLIEHMVFKGTQKRSARDIAVEIDNMGGQINAFTSKDCTCFYTKTLDNDLESAIEMLSDMLFHSTFDEQALEVEKNVIYEEINMYEDDPEELVHDILSEEVWHQGPLGNSILGTKETLERMDRNDILEYMSEYYLPDNCVISVVGNFDEKRLMDTIEKYFHAWRPKKSSLPMTVNPPFKSRYHYRQKNIEQVHVCLGFDGISMSDDRLFPMLVLNNIIGGGMSSRLFQTIREELGMAYSIYSVPSFYKDTGLFTIYAATNPDQVNDMLNHMHAEIDGLITSGIGVEELERCKRQLKGSYILGLDSTTGRMTTNGKSKLITGIANTPDEILSSIEKVNMDDIAALVKFLFVNKLPAAVVLGETDIDSGVLERFHWKM